jgi:hypothetical protein
MTYILTRYEGLAGVRLGAKVMHNGSIAYVEAETKVDPEVEAAFALRR